METVLASLAGINSTVRFGDESGSTRSLFNGEKFMKTFVVNLDKDTERMAFLDKQLKRFGVSYERIPAVHGTAMTSQELKRDFSRIRSLFAQGRKLNLNEIGCSLSHVKTYRKIIDQNIPVALILEDDVILDARLNEVLPQVEAFMSASNPQVVMLSNTALNNPYKTGIEQVHNCVCTDGYVINLSAARLLYRANYPVLTVSDMWKRWERFFGLETYRAYPAVVRQDNEKFASNLWPKRTAQETIEIMRRAWRRRPLKLIYKLLDRFCFWFSGR